MVDANDQRCAPGEQGELWLGGAQGLFRIAPGGRELQAIHGDDAFEKGRLAGE